MVPVNRKTHLLGYRRASNRYFRWMCLGLVVNSYVWYASTHSRRFFVVFEGRKDEA